MDIVIRCDVGSGIGLGHYSRCIALKKALEQNGAKVSLALKHYGNEKIPLAYDLLIEGVRAQEVEKYNFTYKNMFLDILHNQSLNNNLPGYIASLKSAKNRISLIEGLEDDACPAAIYSNLDALFTPYVQLNGKKQFSHHFLGKDYLIIDPTRIIHRKIIRDSANKVLMTFGGSDPFNQTMDAINNLKMDRRSDRLDIVIILGPLMDRNQIEVITSCQVNFKMSFIHSPKNLRNYFEWADLAITNTGHTRYELAASGVPFIILPFDYEGYKKSVIFQQLGSAYLAAGVQNPEQATYINDIFNILDDKELRLKMSLNGRKNFYSRSSLDNFAKTLIRIYQ